MVLGEIKDDVITDFAVAGTRPGDLLLFRGFGPGGTLTNAGGDLWTASDGATSETFQIAGVTVLGAGDYLFV